jgi:redox-sensitive bicupin YhaK (pirin superfamily)
MSPPRYQDLLDAQIPAVDLAGGAGAVRVIAGEFRGTRGPARTFTTIELLDVRLRAARSATLSLPAGHTAIVLVQAGAVRIGETDVQATEMAFLELEGDAVQLATGAADARLLVLAGEPIHESVVGYGPFVMNTKAEIGQAIEDFESGKMGHLGS